MKKITITCEQCGKSRTIKADNELIDEISNATLILCQKTHCKQAYPLKKEKGFIRNVHFFGDFWSFDIKQQ